MTKNVEEDKPLADKLAATKKRLVEACNLLYERGLVSGSGGNISIRADIGVVLITPTGLSFKALRPKEISVIDLRENLLEGKPPSMEASMHLKVLDTRPDISVVCHCHGPYSVAASTLLSPGANSIPPLTPGFVYHAYPLYLLSFEVPGSSELAEAVAKALAKKGTKAVLLQNHGMVTVGKDLREAINIAEEIEEAAKIYLLTKGKGKILSDGHIAQIKKLGA